MTANKNRDVGKLNEFVFRSVLQAVAVYVADYHDRHAVETLAIANER